jgi:hypothetical protein
MFAFIHPHVKHIVTYSVDSTDVTTELAAHLEDEQSAHIRRQIVQISQGKDLDQISALASAENLLRAKALHGLDD